jgi:hypothetical protein
MTGGLIASDGIGKTRFLFGRLIPGKQISHIPILVKKYMGIQMEIPFLTLPYKIQISTFRHYQ